MKQRPTFGQLFAESIKSEKTGVNYLNEFVRQKELENPIGFYLYTKKEEHEIYSYKFGQTKNHASERVHEQRSASTTEKFLIIDWYPSDLALTNKYDQKILRDLHNQGKCILRNVLDEDLTTKEWAVFPDDNPQEIIRDHLSKIENGLTRSELQLTIWQIEAIDRLYSMLNAGPANKKIVAELAARFGKTLTFLALFHYMKQRVMIVGTYYLTALNSFKDEVVRYKEFENFEVLDLADVDFQESYRSLMDQGKKIVVVASLCGDKEKDETVRNQNAEFISKVVDKITVIDEADYGSHTPSCVPFVNKLGKNSSIILTTGTNSERAANNHNGIDGIISITYLDMQMKALSDKVKIQNDFMKECKRAIEFEKNLVPVEFYRFDWSPFASFLNGNSVELNPSFAKVSADVNKHAGFWKGLYKSLLGLSSNIDMNDYSLENCLNGKSESVIQFVSVKSNTQLKNLTKIAKSVVGQEYDVYSICGDDIEGKDAEQFVKDKIAVAKYHGKKVWIIADRMCQRSFSVSDINVVLLCYDNGDRGATIQKISRVLTNGNRKKTGYVISLSIDGNRDDKISPMIMDAAKQVALHENIDIVSALRKVMKSFPIFQMGTDGYILQLDVDDYAKEIFSSSNAHRIIMNNDRLMYEGILDEIDCVESSIEKAQAIKEFALGKTYIPQEESKDREPSSFENQLIQERKNKLTKIIDRTSYCVKEIQKTKGKVNYQTFIDILNTNQFVSDTIGTTAHQFDKLVEEKYLDLNLFSIYVEQDS